MIDALADEHHHQSFPLVKRGVRYSFLYITHDLATAYYISDYIAVMYRGSIVEFGDARKILADPQHPYTQLLLASIPDTRTKWNRQKIALSDIEAKEFGFTGCRFCNRCPIAEDRCRVERPPAIKKEDGREVYCHFA
ncbi:MAG: ABC transporter ATP-binding protein [Caldilineaceae bacterium]